MSASFTAVRPSPSVLRLVATAAVALALIAVLLWIERDLDRQYLLAHNQLRANPSVVALSGAVSRFGMSAICLVLLAWVAASFRIPALSDARAALLVVLFSFAAAALAGTVLKEILGRARPIVELAGQLNAPGQHGSPSFPSGHAAKSMALALPFVLVVPPRILAVRVVKLALLFLAALVCYSRIVLGAHYLSDILAGTALGLACVLVATPAANAIFHRGKVTPKKLNTMAKRLMLVLLILTVALPYL